MLWVYVSGWTLSTPTRWLPVPPCAAKISFFFSKVFFIVVLGAAKEKSDLPKPSVWSSDWWKNGARTGPCNKLLRQWIYALAPDPSNSTTRWETHIQLLPAHKCQRHLNSGNGWCGEVLICTTFGWITKGNANTLMSSRIKCRYNKNCFNFIQTMNDKRRKINGRKYCFNVDLSHECLTSVCVNVRLVMHKQNL